VLGHQVFGHQVLGHQVLVHPEQEGLMLVHSGLGHPGKEELVLGHPGKEELVLGYPVQEPQEPQMAKGGAENRQQMLCCMVTLKGILLLARSLSGL
jgi:hypothetical protein